MDIARLSSIQKLTMLNLEKGEIMNMIKMKCKGVMRLTPLFCLILFGFYLFNYQASSSPMVPRPPILLTNAFVPGGTIPSAIAIPMPMGPPQFIIPPLSARQACTQIPGWQWREGAGFTMCFRPGHAMCPVGHPWMRRITPHYTVCLSLENPTWMSPDMNVR